MSSHGANLIFFNKKNKDWAPRTLANPPLPTSDNISFLPYPPTLKMDVIDVSPLIKNSIDILMISETKLDSSVPNGQF